MFQSFNLVPTLTAAENITIAADLGGTPVDRDWFEVLVAQLKLADRLSHRPRELSGGQQQRVACARALIGRPELIFADEPTGNLDSNASAEVLEFLRRAVNEHSQSIVMVTHDPLAAAYADLVGVHGRRNAGRRTWRAHGRHGLGADAATGGAEMRRITLRGLMARKLRLVLTALAIVLGVTFVTGTLVLGDTLNRTFDNLVGTAYQHVSFQIRGKAAFDNDSATVNSTADRKPVPQSLVASVSRVPGVAEAFGSVSGYAQFMTRDGDAIGKGGGSTLASRLTPTRSCRPTAWPLAARPRPPATS